MNFNLHTNSTRRPDKTNSSRDSLRKNGHRNAEINRQAGQVKLIP
jgi:hypothetical protein